MAVGSSTDVSIWFLLEDHFPNISLIKLYIWSIHIYIYTSKYTCILTYTYLMLLKHVSFIKKNSVNGKHFGPHFKVKLQFPKLSMANRMCSFHTEVTTHTCCLKLRIQWEILGCPLKCNSCLGSVVNISF